MTMNTDTQLPHFIQNLLRPENWPQPPDEVSLLQTHISWVLLGGEWVYKIKKPVDFGFINFSTLEQRRYYCHEELRLNRRLAPDIYLEVVPIGGDPDHPRLETAQGVFEYAVKMRAFPQEARLDRVLANRRLRPTHIDQLAEHLAEFHADIERAPADSEWGRPEAVYQPMEENFQIAAPILAGYSEAERLLDHLRDWTAKRFQAVSPTLERRREEQFIRECHGDLHLENMALVNDRVLIFDAIEFNPALRWIDPMNEIAFLTMDLRERNRSDLAFRLLNVYLTRNGDYAGLELLRFYQVYRALVRAKVDALRLEQTPDDQKALYRNCLAYLRLAESFTRPRPAWLLLTCGVSGSGKSHVSQFLLQQLNAIRLRSDVERKRLFGLFPEQRAGEELYTPENNRKTFDHLEGLCRQILGAGFPVIVDATFLQRAGREQFRRLAGELGVPFRVVYLHAKPSVLHRRVRHRHREDRDASDADNRVLQSQLQYLQPPAADESGYTLSVDNNHKPDWQEILDWLRAVT